MAEEGEERIRDETRGEERRGEETKERNGEGDGRRELLSELSSAATSYGTVGWSDERVEERCERERKGV